MESRTMLERRGSIVGRIEQIPVGEGRTFRTEAGAVAIFRCRDGSVHAVQAECPHAGGPLADGLVGQGMVLCPLHGYAFDLATGEPLARACPALRTHSVFVTADGEIELELAAADAAFVA